MFHPDLARRVERGFGIHTVFSTSALAAPIFALAAMRVNVKHSFYVGDELLNLSEGVLEAGSPLVAQSIGHLEESMNLSVLNRQSGGISSLRSGGDLLPKSGDRMLVVGSLEAVEWLSHLNQPDIAQRR